MQILEIDYFSGKVDCIKMSFIQFSVCALLSVPFMLIMETPTLSAVGDCALPLLYTGVLSSAVAYTLQIVGQKGMDPTIASLILSLESCISVLAGWIILGQQLSIKEFLGCIIMFAAIILAQLPQKNTP